MPYQMVMRVNRVQPLSEQVWHSMDSSKKVLGCSGKLLFSQHLEGRGRSYNRDTHFKKVKQTNKT